MVSGGFGSYLFGMSERIAKESSDTCDFKNPALGWIIGFLFVVSFLGLFSVVPLRKVQFFRSLKYIYLFKNIHWVLVYYTVKKKRKIYFKHIANKFI